MRAKREEEKETEKEKEKEKENLWNLDDKTHQKIKRLFDEERDWRKAPQHQQVYFFFFFFFFFVPVSMQKISDMTKENSCLKTCSPLFFLGISGKNTTRN